MSSELDFGLQPVRHSLLSRIGVKTYLLDINTRCAFENLRSRQYRTFTEKVCDVVLGRRLCFLLCELANVFSVNYALRRTSSLEDLAGAL